ncbi:AraC family transcriptional regulator [Sphingobacterium sp. Ag1]|uniref:AraC family transcriptional regulator n=1 Tax=Sphingobacterium sp. Ag1 TaxID=1643451 RepID=UPI00069C20FB|nr:helix-turn-helix domain-containing protein [Sphingobacterium sp. Ag1]
MNRKNYWLATGLELNKLICDGQKYNIDYDIMVEIEVTALGFKRFRQIAQIIEPPVLKTDQVNIDRSYFFFNKTLLPDPIIRVLFEERIQNNYEFEFNENEIKYLSQLFFIVKNYQEHEDHELSDKFVASILCQMVIFYKMVMEKMVANQPQFNFNTYTQRTANEFLNLIATNFRKEKKLTFYVNQLLISKRTLSNITRTVFNKSPKQLLDDHIIEAAKMLLHRTDMNLKQVSSDLGFLDVNYFYVFFKKCTNMTPNEYRSKKIPSQSEQ